MLLLHTAEILENTAVLTLHYPACFFPFGDTHGTKTNTVLVMKAWRIPANCTPAWLLHYFFAMLKRKKVLPSRTYTLPKLGNSFYICSNLERTATFQWGLCDRGCSEIWEGALRTCASLSQTSYRRRWKKAIPLDSNEVTPASLPKITIALYKKLISNGRFLEFII